MNGLETLRVAIRALLRNKLRSFLTTLGMIFGVGAVVATVAIGEGARATVEEAFASLPKPRRRDPDSVAEAVRRAVRSAIAERWNKKPICHVHVLSV